MGSEMCLRDSVYAPEQYGFDEVPKRLAEIYTEEGVPATFMVIAQRARLLKDLGREDVLAAMRSVPRDLFVPGRAVVDAYAANFARAGFEDEVAQIRERHQAGDREGALAAVSDRMCDAIDVVGSADLVAATVRDYVAAGVDVPVLMPLPWGGDRTQVIADTLRAAAQA